MANNIEIKVRNATDQAIAPIRAWHDDHFTYLDFGPRASSMTTWPVAALVVQGVESPVGTRVTGRDRSMMIVEALGNIVLRNGQMMVCLNTIAPNNDTRYSIPPRINDDPRPADLKDRTEIVRVAEAVPAPLPAPRASIAAKIEKTSTPAAPLVVEKPAAPAKPVQPSNYKVLYAPMTAATKDQLWDAFSKGHPDIAEKTDSAWISPDGDALTSAPAGNDKALVLFSNLTKTEAGALCPPRTKAHAGIPACKIKTGR